MSGIAVSHFVRRLSASMNRSLSRPGCGPRPQRVPRLSTQDALHINPLRKHPIIP